MLKEKVWKNSDRTWEGFKNSQNYPYLSETWTKHHYSKSLCYSSAV